MAKRKTGLFVGADIGGTNITTLLVDESGKVLARNRGRTPTRGGSRGTLRAVVKNIEELLAGAKLKARDLAAIGLGVAGVVDSEKGRVVATPNMQLSGLQIVKPMREKFGVPVALGNDVDMGTLGEAWLGAARGARSVVGIFVGTGIGGGIILEGRLVRGARMAAGEVGHIVMMPGGPLCGCGYRGCYEALASRTAIERDIREALAAGRESVVTELLDGDLTKRIKSGVLKKALKKGDPLVTEVMERASEITGYACLSVRHLLDPELIVLGGGVVEACRQWVMPVVERVVAADALPGAREGGRVVTSTLGDDACALGAAALAQQHVGLTPSAGAAAPASEYPRVTDTEFGRVTVAGQVYEHDILIRADGKVKKRDKRPVKKLYGTSHMIGPDELARACKGEPQVLIIGTGQDGTAELTEDGTAFLKERGIRVKALPTPRAIEVYNRTKGRKAALIHVTC
jgi:glucokinase